MSSLTDSFNRAAENKTGETPLHIAAKIGRADTVKMLIEAGTSPNARDSGDFRDNQADGFKADPPLQSASDDQADGYKGPPEDEAIEVMRPLILKKARKKIVL